MWPYWDPKVYPNGAKKELTREIYTDILGSPDGQTKGVTTISQELLPQPRLFTQLTQLDLNTESHTIEQDTFNPVSGKVNASYKYLDGEIIVGITQHLQTTLGDSKLHAQGSGGSKT
ncbi:insecticidal delta-endotoxin, partial [Bacillus thuringiensis]